MQYAHQLVQAVARGLLACTNSGLGGGQEEAQKREYLQLGEQLRHWFDQSGYRDVKVQTVGSFTTIGSGPWILHLELEIAGPRASK